MKYENVRSYLKGMSIGLAILIIWSLVIWHGSHLTTLVIMINITVGCIVWLDEAKFWFDEKRKKNL